MSEDWKLSSAFQHRLQLDGFQPVGCHTINGKYYSIKVDDYAAKWNFTVYCFVSLAEGGKYMRIGKVEDTGLRGRLKPNYVNDSLHLFMDVEWIKERMARWSYEPRDATPETLSQLGQFAGGPPPWQRDMWIKYLIPFGGRGLIFARPPASDTRTRRPLAAEEKKLIRLYDPPCNSDIYLPSAHQRKTDWIADHGRPPIRIKRPRIALKAVLIQPDRSGGMDSARPKTGRNRCGRQRAASVSLSGDGNAAIVVGDNSFAGAAWVYTRSGGVWTQQGPKLVGTG